MSKFCIYFCRKFKNYVVVELIVHTVYLIHTNSFLMNNFVTLYGVKHKRGDTRNK